MAYWTTTGSGSGSGTIRDWDVTVESGAVGPLSPGDPPAALPITVTNGGTVPFQVEQVTPQVVNVNPSSCPSSAITVTVADPLPLIPASATETLHAAVTMRSDAPNDCQGARFEVRFTVEGQNA
jgi:hypothetical protein